MDIWYFCPKSSKLGYEFTSTGRLFLHVISMGQCKKDITPLLMHWSYIFLALIHQYVFRKLVNPCCAEFISVTPKKSIFYYISTQRLCRYFKSFLVTDKDSCILYSQYHGCRCPGDTRSQGTSSHGIDLVVPEYSSFRSRRDNPSEDGIYKFW